MPKASALSAASPATMFSCIFRPFRQAVFAACKKARRSSSTSPRGRKAFRQKTSDLSNRGHKQTARRQNSQPGSSFLKNIILVESTRKDAVTDQDRRRLLREARALPPLIFGTIVNSSTVTLESST